MAVIKDIIENLLTFINEQNPSVTNNIRVNFDLLDKNKNSLCICLNDDDSKGEHISDVTGQFIEGSFSIRIYYRDITGVEGIKDLYAYDLLNSLAIFIKKYYNYKVINETKAQWVDKIEIAEQARLIKVYDGNIKDYETGLNFIYIYKKN